jgi:hypothetical protein
MQATQKTTRMRFSPEWWSYWAGVWAVAATAAAAIAGLVSWYFSQVVAEANDRRTAELELRIAEQRERAANAERDLLTLKREMAPRMLDRVRFLEYLKGKPKGGSVEILYKDNDEEAYTLAVQIQRWLGPGVEKDGAGWPIMGLRALKESDALHPDPNLPTVIRSGFFFSGSGVMLSTRALPSNPFDETHPAIVLRLALERADITALGLTEDPSLPQSMIRVIVGPK